MNGYKKKPVYNEFRRYCKMLKLQEDNELIRKYIEVHKPGNVWPEILNGIKEVGIIDMEIYIKDNIAFMIMDTVPDFNHDEAMKKLESLPGQKKWEEYVAQFQDAGSKADTPEKWGMTERAFILE
jgi:L-rhamnose mutarotase